MRRAVLTLGGTVAGLAALFSFKTHSLAGVSALDPPAAPTTGTSAPPTTPATVVPTTGTSASSAKPPSASPTTPSGAGATSSVTPTGQQTSAATPTRTVTGTVASTQYGPMQVQVTLAGTRITKVTVLQQTDDGAMSDQIDSFAIPKLTAETLTAQSARIDTVSGASYTSSGYIQSLQSALDG